jgi:hypothetical protein
MAASLTGEHLHIPDGREVVCAQHEAGQLQGNHFGLSLVDLSALVVEINRKSL